MNKNKGDFMKYVFSEGELPHIDSATPMDSWENYPPLLHVMNYNISSFGTLQNLFEVAKSRGLDTKEFNHFLKYHNE